MAYFNLLRFALFLKIGITISLSAAYADFEWRGQWSYGGKIYDNFSVPLQDIPKAKSKHVPSASLLIQDSHPTSTLDKNTSHSLHSGTNLVRERPLVIALQQIVPAGYQFSFSDYVHIDILVSWDKGCDWRFTLSKMLKAHGLTYRLDDKTLFISKSERAGIHNHESTTCLFSIPEQRYNTPVSIRRENPSGIRAENIN
jgi:hypothetical protein